MTPWIGVDLDGTLAKHGTSWPVMPPWSIGEPIPRMVEIVKEHLAKGDTVKIFTARISEASRIGGAQGVLDELDNIRTWTQEHIGVPLLATSTKDFNMKFFYDDRAIWVQQDQGVVWTPQKIEDLQELAWRYKDLCT